MCDSQNSNNKLNNKLYQYKGKVIKISSTEGKIHIYIYVDENKLLEKNNEKYLPLIDKKAQKNDVIDCKGFRVEKENDKYLLKLTLNEAVKDWANALLTSNKIKVTFNENREIQDLELYG